MPRKNEPLERMCLVTREVKPVGEMIRFVLGPDGAVVPDLKRTLPGRGVWVGASRDVLATAVKKRLFGRGFGEEAKADEALVDLVDRLLTEAALGNLGLARKAGQVVTGFAKVEATVGKGQALGLIHAAEAGDDGVEKIAAALRRRGASAAGIPVLRCFTSGQLDLALGRENVVHAALLSGQASKSFLERVDLLRRYRGGVPATVTDRDGDEPGSDPVGMQNPGTEGLVNEEE